jgi:cytochrome c biogenesis protein CcmG/thiol:disulfide interchange protein DsbE
VNLRVLLLGLALAVPLFVVLALGFGHDPRAIESPLVGKPAPAFALTPLEGGPAVSVASLRGTPVVLNFWATWCVPCQQEHGELQAAARRWRDRARFVGVVYQDRPEAIRAWLARMGVIGTTLVDVGSQVALAYGVTGVPETFIIGPDGVIAHKFTGPVTAADLDARLSALPGGAL